MTTFRSALGSTDKPFGKPGDLVTISLDPTCHPGADPFPATADDYVVTMVFTPPNGGPVNVVALSTNCGAVDTATCAALPTVATATCLPANGVGQPVGMEKLDGRTLRFRFPDTDAQFLAPNDDLTFTGPAAVAVSRIVDPLPCGLATTTCAEQGNVRACVDALFAADRSCDSTPGETFTHFTALPPPNNYAALCTDPLAPSGPCTGTVDEVRFTVDADGNLLLPMDWRGVRVDRDAVPVARLLRGSTTVEAFEGRGVAIRIPSLDSLGSYSPEGIKLPPLFDPQRDANDTTAATFFGSTDAAETVLRVARHLRPSNQCAGGLDAGLPCLTDSDCPGSSCALPACIGGGNAGAPCVSDAGCTGGACGPGLFEFRTRLLSGTGPVLLRLGACIGGSSALDACTDDSDCSGGQCGDFSIAALDPVPLDGLNQSAALNALVLEEAIPNPPADFNGDGDQVDHVVKLFDRATGAGEAIGEGGAEGRAVARVQQPPFSFPALATENDLIAFLEPEALQGDCSLLANCDQNGDGDIADTIRRVFQLGGGELTDPMAPETMDAAPLVNGRSVAVSDGRVFFRQAESADVPQTTRRVAAGAASCSMSADARFLACRRYNLGNDRVVVIEIATGLESTLSFDQNSSSTPRISADGRWIAHIDNDPVNGPIKPIRVHDRLNPGPGVIVSVSTAGVAADASPWADLAISADGRLVAWETAATNLDPADTSSNIDIYLHDRDADADGVFDEPGAITTRLLSPGSQQVFHPAISADGHFVAYDGCLLGPPIVCAVWLYDTVDDVRTRVDVASDGSVPFYGGGTPSLSADGRYIAFASGAPDLVAGDTNGTNDIFVRDRDRGITTRVSLTSSGGQGSAGPLGNGAFVPKISADGRYVAFQSLMPDLVVDDGNPNGNDSFRDRDVFLHDRLTGITTRVSVTAAGAQANHGCSAQLSLSADGFTVAFDSHASNLVAGDTNGNADGFVRGADPASSTGDLSGDGDRDDTLLRVLATDGAVTTLCPADAVAVAGGRAAFLRPESAGESTGCPALPLNDLDPDDGDRVVHLWDGTAVQNLAVAATAVALSDQWVAALVSEAAQNAFNLNPSGGDTDTEDTVVEVHPLSGGSWINLGQAADHVEVQGDVVAFLTPEAAQGQNLNPGGLPSDTDLDDRVVQLYRADTSTFIPVAQAAEELVVGDTGLIAFRTLEAAQGGQVLNGDGDTLDGVLQIFDAAAEQLIPTGFAVTPCPLEACDPRVHYRVLNDTVKFLTLEGDQGEDLNQDGDLADLVLQSFNVRLAQDILAAPLTFDARGVARSGGFFADARTVLGAVSAGICTDTAHACTRDADCPAGTCFVPPGGCLADLGTSCNPQALGSCPLGQFCQPLLAMPNMGTCFEVQGQCRADADCTAPATCSGGEQTFQRLLAPLAEQQGGVAVFTGAGRCVENLGAACTTGDDCDPGAYCAGGFCRRDQGVCSSAADCPTGATCEQSLLRSTVDDADLDEIPDPFDNCPRDANVRQEDADGDGRGDACDRTLVPLAGKKLIIKDPDGEPAGRSAIFLAKDAGTTAPVPGSGDDPTSVGATLTISNPLFGDAVDFPLPAANWRGLGNPPGSSGYKYKDATQTGPCTKVLIKRGKLIKARCGGAASLALARPRQNGLAVRLTTGSIVQCALFGGELVADTPASGGAGLFKAKNAVAPTTCEGP